MLPRTPKERADDLRAIGATIGKLPSFKRGEFTIDCPTCGGVAVWDGRRHRFISHDQCGTMKSTFKSDTIDRINLDDETWHRGGPWETKRRGHDVWLALRFHVLTCSRGELDDERRATAVRYAHEIVRRIDDTPEIAGLVLRELASTLRAWVERSALGEFADLEIRRAIAALEHTGGDLVNRPLPHLPEATREARAKAKEESDARVREGTRRILKTLPGAIERASKGRKP